MCSINYIDFSLLFALCIVNFVVAPTVDNHSSTVLSDSFKKSGESLIVLNSKGMYKEMFEIQELNEKTLTKQYYKVILQYYTFNDF